MPHFPASLAAALVLATWTLLACLFLTESPQDHRFASDAEKKYLAAQPHMKKTDNTKVCDTVHTSDNERFIVPNFKS